MLNIFLATCVYYKLDFVHLVFQLAIDHCRTADPNSCVWDRHYCEFKFSNLIDNDDLDLEWLRNYHLIEYLRADMLTYEVEKYTGDILELTQAAAKKKAT